jgi:hypothetical protein
MRVQFGSLAAATWVRTKGADSHLGLGQAVGGSRPVPPHRFNAEGRRFIVKGLK